jgi:peptidoglycan/LPS O-acetylase OafA/YrhL
MIQRIQTVYLLLVSGLMISMLFLPIITIESMETIHWSLSVESVLTAILALTAIFFYKKRKLQINLCYIILGLLVLSYLNIIFDLWLPNRGNTNLKIEATIVFPFFALVLDILALCAIRKDEKLVRSADRLR